MTCTGSCLTFLSAIALIDRVESVHVWKSFPAFQSKTSMPPLTWSHHGIASPPETGSEHWAETGQSVFRPWHARASPRYHRGTTPGLTSVASLVDHEHIGADANDPTDITL